MRWDAMFFVNSPAAILMIGSLFISLPLHAEETLTSTSNDYWELKISPYTYHYQYSPEHKDVVLIGIEHHRSDQWFIGGALFSNSFGQPTGTAYMGYTWDRLFGQSALYAKLGVGLMYGYVGKYKDKVPLNYNGLSPILVPAAGWKITSRDAIDVSLLGIAGLLFSYNRKF
ncbi:ABC transporter ATP-binding protein [Collimonas humicola]|uniref:ABC transporter ATP-binding protein n=1 Tax=Collimonas humicola TaxID=2825886 RepID=UPI001B8B3214|nr:ABC transporter ATP-binding protein [Collimonas humicola]